LTLPATLWHAPRMIQVFSIMVRQCHILLPIFKQDFEIMDFVFYANTTIGMHCWDLVEVLARFTKPSKVISAKELDLHLLVSNQGVEFDHVEHRLLSQSWEVNPSVDPKLYEPDRPLIRSHILKPSIWKVQDVTRVAIEEITSYLEICIFVK